MRTHPTTLVHRIDHYETPRSVFALAFSPDGARLVAGGGCFYGFGFLRCFQSSAQVVWTLEEKQETFTGVSFDAAGDHLAIASLSYRFGYAPARILRLRRDAPPVTFFRTPQPPKEIEPYMMATGVLLDSGKLVVRRNATFAGHTFESFDLPDDAPICGLKHERASTRVAALGGLLATGFSGSSTLLASGTNIERIGDVAGLAVINRDAGNETQLLATPHEGVITAITADTDAGTLYTFAGDGSIVAWRDSDTGLAVTARWHTAHAPTGAACVLASGGYVVTAQGESSVRNNASSSRIEVWKGAELVGAWTVEGMLARALAAHPMLPRIAVGGKTQGSLSPGIVRTFDLDLDGFGGQTVT